MSSYATGEASDTTFGGEKSLAISSNNLGHVSQAVHANMNSDYAQAAQDGLLERTVTYSQYALDVWQGTRLAPMNRGRVRCEPAAQEDPPTPTSSEKEFEDNLRLNKRAEGGGNVGGAAFDDTDPWLGPAVADRDLTEIQREIRRGILLRDAQNRVVRRPYYGSAPRGAEPRDRTSPTPPPRRQQRNQVRSQQQIMAMPPVLSTIRPAEYQQMLPPLANQSGYSAMVRLGGVGDHGNGVYAVRREPRPSSNCEYYDASLDNRAIFSPPVYRGRSNQTSTYDTTCGTWNGHGNATGGHLYDSHEYGWIANYTNPVWQPSEFTSSESYLTGSHVTEEGQAETVYDSIGNLTHD
ncbi:hypothetical protein V8F33_013897 [Rhypophila sp. PSN 637]